MKSIGTGAAQFGTAALISWESRMRVVVFLLAMASLSTHAAGAEKSFDGITCQSNISSALVGRHMPNERAASIEERYKSIRLKDIGAFGMEAEGDPWTLISWEICGREYLLLERQDVVKDVLASEIPPGGPHAQIASCAADGSKLPGTGVAFVERDEKKWPRAVKSAWLIDDKKIKFVKVTANEIVCTPFG